MKDASLKAQPSLYGVVIDKKLFSRVNKDNKKGKQAEKVQFDKIDAQFAQARPPP